MSSFTAGLAAILAVSGGCAFAARWNAIATGLPTASPGVTALAIDPATTSTLYALTRSGTIFKSSDGGGHWRPSNGVVGVFFLAADPKNSSTLYAATRHGVVKSRDGGESWSSASGGLTDGYAYSLAISPSNPSMLYTVTPNGVFKSADGGANWKAAGSSSTTRVSEPLVIDPNTPSTIYAAHSTRGMVISTDEGETWTAINPTYDLDYTITGLAVDPMNSSTVYAGFVPHVFLPAGGSPTGGIFKSTDGGKTWNAFQDGMPDSFFVTSLTIDPLTPSNIYAVVTSNGGGGIVKSSDGGQRWSMVNDGLPGNRGLGPLAIDPQVPSTLYAGSTDLGAGAVFKSTRGGEGWKQADTGLAGVDSRALAIDPVSAAGIYAGVGDGVFKKNAMEAGWTKLVSFEVNNTFSLIPGGPPLAGPAPASLRSIAIDFANPNVLYAWTNRDNGCVVFDKLLFKSADGGANWNDAASPPENPCVTTGFLVMDPTDSSTLYLAEADEFEGSYWVRKSVDGGGNWNDIWYSEEYGPNVLLIDPASPGALYAGTGSGVFQSADGGVTWSNIGLKGVPVTALSFGSAGSGILYAATAGAYPEAQGFRGLFKSTDDGTNWTPADSGLGGLAGVGATITSLVTALNGGALYAGTSGDGVYRSADGGASWLRLNDGLSNLEIRALIVGPGANGSLYAATAGGIFKIADEITR